MSPAKELIVRNGTVLDGNGGDPFLADVVVVGDTITAIGAHDRSADVEIDATGCLVTPGFIDIHSHFDGHVTWEHQLKPDSGHGITTTVMGNCGVGFAPCRPEHRAFTIELMEGVEDIPRSVLEAGLPWAWQTFPEYRRFLAGRRFDMNVTGLVPHSSLRVWVMGERAIAGQPATVADVEAMSELVHEAIDCGAVGVGSTRLDGQRTLAGVAAPSRAADEAELMGIARGMERAGRGVLQIAPEFNEFPRAEFELAMAIRVAAETGRPLTFSLKQSNRHPEGWRRLLAMARDAVSAGIPVYPQVLGRPTGAILGWDCSIHPFVETPTYRRLAHLPPSERIEALSLAATRAAILEEVRCIGSRFEQLYGLIFPINGEVDYEPSSEHSLRAASQRSGRAPDELLYDHFCSERGDGKVLYAAGNFTHGTLEPALEMMRGDNAVFGLGDGGAHCTIVCDASAPTHLLTYWTRDRTVGDRLPLATVVRKLTSEPAELFGLRDRGRIGVGMKADLNVIQYEELSLSPPRIERDLPAGGKRLVQDATGYVATIVNGVVVYDHGTFTGELPGILV